MSRTDTATHAAPVGAVDGQAVCRHADPLVLPTDPEREYLRPCQRPGVFRVPRPHTRAPVALCAWHLARYLEAYPDVGDTLRADRNAGEYVAEPAITALEDTQAPSNPRLAGRRWRRAALDQRGHVHYASRPAPDEDIAPAILEVDGGLEQIRVVPLGQTHQSEYMEAVRRRVGWAAFADFVALPTGGGD